MKTRKPKRSNFLLAAEMLAIAQSNFTKGYDHDERLEINLFGKVSYIYCTWFCCNALRQLDTYEISDSEPEMEFLKKWFMPEDLDDVHGAWWPNYDFESRILALLLCAEMCRR